MTAWREIFDYLIWEIPFVDAHLAFLKFSKLRRKNSFRKKKFQSKMIDFNIVKNTNNLKLFCILFLIQEKIIISKNKHSIKAFEFIDPLALISVVRLFCNKNQRLFIISIEK